MDRNEGCYVKQNKPEREKQILSHHQQNIEKQSKVSDKNTRNLTVKLRLLIEEKECEGDT